MHRLASALTLALTVLASTVAVAADTFQVETALSVSGQTQTTTPVGVDANTATQLWGDSDWQLFVTITPIDDPFALANALWMTVRLEAWLDEQWQPISESVLGVPPGEWAALTVGGVDQDDGVDTVDLINLRLRVSPQP